MQELEITSDRLLRVWWFIVWQSVLTIGGFVLFTSGAAMMANRIFDLSLPPPSSNIGGYIVMSLLFLFFVVQRALKKKYRDFRIVLVSISSS
jgi:hypothetical protein